MSNSDRLSLLFDAGRIALSAGSKTLVLRATPAAGLRDLGDVTCIQGFKPTYDALVQTGVPTFASLSDAPSTTYDIAIVEITRSKPETLGLLATAYAALNDNGTLIVNGAKTDGIESHLKTLRRLLPITDVVSKAHGKIFWLTKSNTPDAFATWITDAAAQPNAAGFHTAAGVFSADRIDLGSSLLAEHLPKTLSGNGADLGAGWGWLSHHLLATTPEIKTLALYEAEQAALDCAAKNVTDPRATFHWTDAREIPAKQNLDFIIMNPPFHETRRADQSLGQSFIQKAASMLSKRGHLWMVANRQLAYESTLADCFVQSERIAQTPQYKIFHASRPTAAR